jgi:hypothetical protein
MSSIDIVAPHVGRYTYCIPRLQRHAHECPQPPLRQVQAAEVESGGIAGQRAAAPLVDLVECQQWIADDHSPFSGAKAHHGAGVVSRRKRPPAHPDFATRAAEMGDQHTNHVVQRLIAKSRVFPGIAPDGACRPGEALVQIDSKRNGLS